MKSLEKGLKVSVDIDEVEVGCFSGGHVCEKVLEA